MDALVIHAPGDLRVEDFPIPAVDAGQVRLRVRAGGICGSDLHYYQHGGFGTIRIQQPMVLGHEVAGVIEEVSPDVAGFAVVIGHRQNRNLKLSRMVRIPRTDVIWPNVGELTFVSRPA